MVHARRLDRPLQLLFQYPLYRIVEWFRRFRKRTTGLMCPNVRFAHVLGAPVTSKRARLPC